MSFIELVKSFIIFVQGGIGVGLLVGCISIGAFKNIVAIKNIEPIKNIRFRRLYLLDMEGKILWW